MKKTHVTKGKKHIQRNEGDQWEENGRLWTIKNGIKRTVSKLEEARKKILTPLACPDCGKAMKHHLDIKMWKINQTCFDCLVNMEQEIRRLGKWEEYEKKKVLSNAKSFLHAMKAELGEYAEDSMQSSHVTEDGKVEKWQNADNKVIKEYIDKEISNLENTINEFESGEEGVNT